MAEYRFFSSSDRDQRNINAVSGTQPRTTELQSASKSICFLMTSLSYGGAQTLVIELIMQLLKRGWKVNFISMIPPTAATFVQRLTAAGVEVVSLGMRRGVANPRALFQLAGILSRWRPSIVHSHMVHANLLARAVRLIAPVPVLVSTAHNVYEGSGKLMLAYRISDWLADVTTNVSQAAVERYIAIHAVPAKKIRFIPNGIDVHRFRVDEQRRQTCRKQLGVTDEFVWFAVGRIDAAKDYPTMLRAFNQTRTAKRSLLLVAGEGPLENEMKQLCAQLNIVAQTRFLGVTDQIPDLLNAADAYLMSSAWEGMPIVLLEAAASGLPIVATDVGGNREVVIDGKSGLLVPPHTPDKLAVAMQHLMHLPVTDRRLMGHCGRNHVLKNYNIERIADQWEKLYCEFFDNNFSSV